MPEVVRGVINGKTIELEKDPGLPDGQIVEVRIEPIDPHEATEPEAATPPDPEPRFFIVASGEPVTSVARWYDLAPPARGELHWQEGRSAMELARAWIGDGTPRVPGAVTALLQSHDMTRGFVPIIAYPELVTDLDHFSGGHRNHDLVVTGSSGRRPTLLGIEAKADESFGNETIGTYYARMIPNVRSNVPLRIKNLTAAVFGAAYDPESPGPIFRLRYQLLTAVAGTLIEANLCDAVQSVFIVHTFTSVADPARGWAGTNPLRVLQNEAALNLFVQNLPGAAGAVGLPLADGRLAGPFFIPGGGLVPSGVPLYVGKVTTPLNG